MISSKVRQAEKNLPFMSWLHSQLRSQEHSPVFLQSLPLHVHFPARWWHKEIYIWNSVSPVMFYSLSHLHVIVNCVWKSTTEQLFIEKEFCVHLEMQHCIYTTILDVDKKKKTGVWKDSNQSSKRGSGSSLKETRVHRVTDKCNEGVKRSFLSFPIFDEEKNDQQKCTPKYRKK